MSKPVKPVWRVSNGLSRTKRRSRWPALLPMLALGVVCAAMGWAAGYQVGVDHGRAAIVAEIKIPQAVPAEVVDGFNSELWGE